MPRARPRPRRAGGEPLAEPATFSPEGFVETRVHDAAAKARFASHFTAFVAAGFPETLFHGWFYQRLHGNTFSLDGEAGRPAFYDRWFSGLAPQLRFVERVLQHRPLGSPERCFVDVEIALQAWLRDSGVLERLTAALAAEVEQEERALLRTLLARYPDEPARMAAPSGPPQTELFAA